MSEGTPAEQDATRHWQRVRQIFEAVVDLPAAGRSAALDEECGEDTALRAEVEELLAADTETEDRPNLLDTPPAAALAQAAGRISLLGQEVDGFAVRRLIGSGGMGAVYEAVQHNPKRRVALKVMGQGLLDAAAVRRFRYESEILGRLQHPGIAQVYAAGTHQLGTQAVPYFAMELVEGGQELNTHAAARGLDVHARLRLMIEICEAVHYGHLRGVIHRDLKPANILVDRAGHAKIIDFGIARCTDVDFAGLSMQTQTGLLLGTLQFMSPEQVRGQRGEVDARSDVYALGVILYQLLTGALPHDLSERSLPEAGRIICEEDPVPPWQHDKRLRGDLGTIIRTAMARDLGQRYSSAGDLARDLRNFLGDHPISARPPSTFYQVRKFARRHTGLLSAAVAVLITLVVGLVAVSIQNLRIQEEAARTLQEQQRAELIVAYLRDVLSSAEAIAGKGPDYTVREALDASAERLGPELAGLPAVEAELREVIGVTYMRLSLFAAAEPHLERCAELARGLEGPIRVRAPLALARLRMHQDRLDQAQRHAAAAVGVAEASFAAEPALLLEAKLDRGRYLALDQRYQAAEELFAEVLERRRAELGPGHIDTLRARFALGDLFVRAGDHQAAAELLEPLLVADHDDEVLSYRVRSAWGSVLRQRGDLLGARTAQQEAYAGLRRRLGAEHRDTLDAGFHLLWVRVMRGEMRASLDQAREILAGCEKVLGLRHEHTRKLQRMVGGILMQRGEVKEGAAMFERAHRAALADKGAGHPETLDVASDLAFAYYRLGEGARALEVCAGVLAEPAGQEGRYGAQCRMVEGLVRLANKDFAAAETALRDSLQRFEAGKGPQSYEVRGVLNCQLQLYQQWNRPEQARQVQARIAAIDAARAAAAKGRGQER